MWNAINRVLTHPQAVLAFLRRKAQDRNRSATNIQEEITALERQAENLKAKEQKLVQAYTDGVFSVEQVEPAMAELKERQKVLHQTREQKLTERQALNTIPQKAFMQRIFKKLEPALRGITLQQQAVVLRDLLEKIEVGRDNAIVTVHLPRLDELPQPRQSAIAFQSPLWLEHNRASLTFKVDINLTDHTHTLVT